MELQFHTLDVFTGERLSGNPLAVVRDGDGLDSARMQRVAREFNLSETVFLLKPDNPRHSAKVRIFTPRQELPFAGHPTVGTACLLGHLQLESAGEQDREAIITLEEKAGLVRCLVRASSSRSEAWHAAFDAPKEPQCLADQLPVARVAEALGLAAEGIGFGDHAATVWSAGVPFTFVPVATRDLLRHASLAGGVWERTVGRYHDGQPGVFVYCAGAGEAAYTARMFAPDDGMIEDPATGSAAAAFAGVFNRFERPGDGVHRLTIAQGEDMGRASRIELEIDVQAGNVSRVRIGGESVHVMQGTLSL